MASSLDLGWRFLYRMFPMVAWWHSYLHIPGSQTCTWTIAQPSTFESIGFVSCADDKSLQDLSCRALLGHQADLWMFLLSVVCHPSLLIFLQPWTSNWMASIRSKASETFACWSSRNWLQENWYDAVSILQTNADYENQGILPRTCTCDSIRDAREGEEVICILRRFWRLISLEDIDLIVRRHSFIDK